MAYVDLKGLEKSHIYMDNGNPWIQFNRNKTAIKPVELSIAYRLLKIRSTTMISAKHDGDEDVMAAAWVGFGSPNKAITYIGKQAYCRYFYANYFSTL